MKKQNKNTTLSEQLTKSNIKMVETHKIDISNTQIPDLVQALQYKVAGLN